MQFIMPFPIVEFNIKGIIMNLFTLKKRNSKLDIFFFYSQTKIISPESINSLVFHLLKMQKAL